MSFMAKDGPLGTAKRRAAYVHQKFPLVSPIEYIVEKGKKTLAYVSILSMLQKLLNNTDVLNRAMSEKVSVAQEYRSYVDGQYFNENSFLTRDEFTIALGLYIDDFEIANPLGTSKLKHNIGSLPTYLQNIGQPSIQYILLYYAIHPQSKSVFMQKFCNPLSMI